MPCICICTYSYLSPIHCSVQNLVDSKGIRTHPSFRPILKFLYKNSTKLSQWPFVPLSFLPQATPRPKNRHRSYIQRDLHNLSFQNTKALGESPRTPFLDSFKKRRAETRRHKSTAAYLTSRLSSLSLFCPRLLFQNHSFLLPNAASLGYGGLSPNGRRYESASSRVGPRICGACATVRVVTFWPLGFGRGGATRSSWEPSSRDPKVMRLPPVFNFALKQVATRRGLFSVRGGLQIMFLIFFRPGQKELRPASDLICFTLWASWEAPPFIPLI